MYTGIHPHMLVCVNKLFLTYLDHRLTRYYRVRVVLGCLRTLNDDMYSFLQGVLKATETTYYYKSNP
jgi:hypothetical protein